MRAQRVLDAAQADYGYGAPSEAHRPRLYRGPMGWWGQGDSVELVVSGDAPVDTARLCRALETRHATGAPPAATTIRFVFLLDVAEDALGIELRRLLLSHGFTVIECTAAADRVARAGLVGLANLKWNPGLIGVDTNDLAHAMTSPGGRSGFGRIGVETDAQAGDIEKGSALGAFLICLYSSIDLGELARLVRLTESYLPRKDYLILMTAACDPRSTLLEGKKRTACLLWASPDA